jgi:hypothetical protein
MDARAPAAIAGASDVVKMKPGAYERIASQIVREAATLDVGESAVPTLGMELAKAFAKSISYPNHILTRTFFTLL